MKEKVKELLTNIFELRLECHDATYVSYIDEAEDALRTLWDRLSEGHEETK